MLASLATIMKEKTALVTSMVYFALTNIPHIKIGMIFYFAELHERSEIVIIDIDGS